MRLKEALINMVIQKIKKAVKCFRYFKNPFVVIKFLRGKFIKGDPTKIKPREGDSFFIARLGDCWLIDKILNKEKVVVNYNSRNNQNYIIEDNIYLRQGTSDTYIYKEIFIDQCYKKYVDKLTKDSIVIDIGAHIGLFSLYCSPLCEKIYALEAHHENYELAQKNIISKKAKNIKLFNLAVWSVSGKAVQLLDDEKDQTGEYRINIYNKNINNRTFQVKTITIEDIFIKNNINLCNLLKIDIEGAEYAALLSTPDIIFNKISLICMEYHPDLENKHTIDDLIKFLEDKGFIVEIKELKQSVGLLYARK